MLSDSPASGGTRLPRPFKVLLALALGFLIAEVSWRVYLFGFADTERLQKWGRLEDMAPETLRFGPHPYTVYGLNPRYRSPGGLDRHNSLGYRGADFLREKPAGVYRIACIGGSSTYDVHVEDPAQAFPAQLEAVLREDFGHAQVHVVNAGVPGYSTWESVVNLQFRVLDLQPDLVIVYHAVNDVTPRRVPPELYFRDNTGYRKSWTETKHLWDYSLLLHYLGVQWGFSARNKLSEWVIWRDHQNDDLTDLTNLDANRPRPFQENLENMVVLSRQHGADVLLTSWAMADGPDDAIHSPVYLKGVAEHNAISRLVAEELGVAFYDLVPHMPGEPEYWADGHHNSALGARRKAELFAAFIAERFLD